MNKFNWGEIRVRDLEETKNFYGSLFDWKIAGNQRKTSGHSACILVNEIDKTLEKIVKLGGKLVVSKSKENGNAMETFADLDGKLFGLYQYAEKV